MSTLAMARARLEERLMATLAALLLAGTLLLSGYFFGYHEITLQVDGHSWQVGTYAPTVGVALARAGVNVGPYDLVQPSANRILRRGAVIQVVRAAPVTVEARGENRQVWLTAPTVGEALAAAGITLTGEEIVESNLNEADSEDLYVRVRALATRLLSTEEKVPAPVVRQEDPALPRGAMRVLQSGVAGMVRKQVEVRLVDGQELDRRVVAEEVLQPASPRVVVIGTAERPLTAARAKEGRPPAGQEMVVEATAYTHTGNRTFTGVWPKVGTVAVDPRVIPLGTRIYVEGYGYGVAQDTGGAIKGNRIDVFFDTESEALRWGRKQVRIYLVKGEAAPK